MGRTAIFKVVGSTGAEAGAQAARNKGISKTDTINTKEEPRFNISFDISRFLNEIISMLVEVNLVD
jgi:hypothetical protein